MAPLPSPPRPLQPGVCGLVVAKTGQQVSLSKALGLSALGAVLSIFAPQVLDAIGVLTLSPFARAAVAALVSAVLAAPLGLGFPGLVAAASLRSPSAAPWLYGLNATVSVGAAALHAGIAPSVGLMGTTIIAAGCYALGAAIIAMRERRTPAVVAA